MWLESSPSHQKLWPEWSQVIDSSHAITGKQGNKVLVNWQGYPETVVCLIDASEIQKNI